VPAYLLPPGEARLKRLSALTRYYQKKRMDEDGQMRAGQSLADAMRSALAEQGLADHVELAGALANYMGSRRGATQRRKRRQNPSRMPRPK